MRYTIVLDSDRPCYANLRSEEGSLAVNRTITIKDLVNVLLESTKNNKELYHVGKMPQGYIDAVFSDETNFDVMVERPMHQRGAVYSSGVKQCFFIPYPRLLFLIQVRKGKLSGGRCYAVKGDEPICGETELYRFIFSNVSFDSGEICFGGNAGFKVDTSKGLAAVDDIIDMFFNSPYNGDYYRAGYGTTRAVDLPELFTELQTLDKFPEDILISTEKTVRQHKLLSCID